MSKKCKCPAGVPDWIVSYGDMMSLLLTFFIMLYAISSLDAKKATAVASSLNATFGVRPNTHFDIPTKWPDEPDNRGRNLATSTIREGNPTQARIPIRIPKEKKITGIIDFDYNSSTLSSEALQTIQKMSEQMKGSAYLIEVRGRTAVNEHGADQDSLDLAYNRAYNVRKALVASGVKESRIFLTVLGANSVSDSSQSPKTSNSYVDVLLVPVATIDEYWSNY
ncbi:MAG: OmpA family protein [Planctomycetaceae bacterium]|jgi:chemotaxis protein MotB|nr:OmpA family protein [Planctomycetaceae bacterium]